MCLRPPGHNVKVILLLLHELDRTQTATFWLQTPTDACQTGEMSVICISSAPLSGYKHIKTNGTQKSSTRSIYTV